MRTLEQHAAKWLACRCLWGHAFDAVTTTAPLFLDIPASRKIFVVMRAFESALHHNKLHYYKKPCPHFLFVSFYL